MAVVAGIVTGLACAVALALLAATVLLFCPLRWRPLGRFLMVVKLGAVAFTPFTVLAGLGLVVVAVLVGSWWVGVPAALAALGAGVVTLRVGAVRPDLTPLLGDGWEDRVPAERSRRMVGRRWAGRVPTDPEPLVRRDVELARLPGSDRALLCDVWQPSPGTPPSGVAMVYLHGSAYYILDKDVGTRPLFTHLAAQGHVVVDVAYRLFPETDVPGMVADAKRAVAWVRDNATDLSVDPGRVVLAGGSAGGHLALLAAYSREHPALTPPELVGCDPAVRAVVSLYGQVDLAAMYEHTGQASSCHPDDPRPDWAAPPPPWMLRRFGPDAARLRLQLMTVAGRCDWLMGGTPSEVPQRYAVVSAGTYVDAQCPPTLFIHGTHDEMAPVAAVRRLAHALHRARVPVAAVYLPHTDHALDLVAWPWSPPARVATHTLERLLAGLATGDVRPAPDRPDITSGETHHGARRTAGPTRGRTQEWT